MGANAPIEEGAKATVQRIVEAGAEESGKALSVLVEGWKQSALVACRA